MVRDRHVVQDGPPLAAGWGRSHWIWGGVAPRPINTFRLFRRGNGGRGQLLDLEPLTKPVWPLSTQPCGTLVVAFQAASLPDPHLRRETEPHHGAAKYV